MNTEDNRLELALAEKTKSLFELLATKQIAKAKLRILLIAYKNSHIIQLYAKNDNQKSYQLLSDYLISKRSGKLGPKKQEGDKQVPEGFYQINRFNPNSKYHLSLGINYPNESDVYKGHTGSHIYIHGGVESKGCLPVTDDKIKEIYVLAHWADMAGQHLIPVYVFPFEMTEENIMTHAREIDGETFEFWQNLREGFDIFHDTYTELQIKIVNGTYRFIR